MSKCKNAQKTKVSNITKKVKAKQFIFKLK